MTASDDEPAEDILCWTWWDCSRSGVALRRGRPRYLLCQISEEIEEYPDESLVRPIGDEALQWELRAFNCSWTGGRSSTPARGPLGS